MVGFRKGRPLSSCCYHCCFCSMLPQAASISTLIGTKHRAPGGRPRLKTSVEHPLRATTARSCGAHRKTRAYRRSSKLVPLAFAASSQVGCRLELKRLHPFRFSGRGPAAALELRAGARHSGAAHRKPLRAGALSARMGALQFASLLRSSSCWRKSTTAWSVCTSRQMPSRAVCDARIPSAS